MVIEKQGCAAFIIQIVFNVFIIEFNGCFNGITLQVLVEADGYLVSKLWLNAWITQLPDVGWRNSCSIGKQMDILPECIVTDFNRGRIRQTVPGGNPEFRTLIGFYEFCRMVRSGIRDICFVKR